MSCDPLMRQKWFKCGGANYAQLVRATITTFATHLLWVFLKCTCTHETCLPFTTSGCGILMESYFSRVFVLLASQLMHQLLGLSMSQVNVIILVMLLKTFLRAGRDVPLLASANGKPLTNHKWMSWDQYPSGCVCLSGGGGTSSLG